MSPKTACQRRLHRFALVAMVAMLMLIAAGVPIHLPPLQDLLKEQIKADIQQWPLAYLSALVMLVLVLILAGGNLSLRIDAMKAAVAKK
jgi:uncharacterized membrane protein YdjX (TVP38/TMEM64 family)